MAMESNSPVSVTMTVPEAFNCSKEFDIELKKWVYEGTMVGGYGGPYIVLSWCRGVRGSRGFGKLGVHLKVENSGLEWDFEFFFGEGGNLECRF